MDEYRSITHSILRHDGLRPLSSLLQRGVLEFGIYLSFLLDEGPSPNCLHTIFGKLICLIYG